MNMRAIRYHQNQHLEQGGLILRQDASIADKRHDIGTVCEVIIRLQTTVYKRMQ